MKHFAMLCLGVALLAACRKDDVIVCNPTAAASFADLRAAAPVVQTFSFELGKAQFLHTSGGATVAFGANAFVLPNGTVATGTAVLRVRELHSVGDMLLAGLHTNVAYFSNALLVSAGEFNVQVWQGTTRLQWNPALGATGNSAGRPFLTTPIPPNAKDTAQMIFWQLPFAANGAVPVAADSLGWLPTLKGAAGDFNVASQSAGSYRIALPLDSISWSNFDQFLKSGTGTNAPWTWAQMCVPAGASQTRVYFRPVGYTSLSRTFATADPTLWNNHFPEGTEVQVIVLQTRNDQLYFGTQNYTWKEGAVMAPALDALSAAEVVQRIRQL